eukprot:449805_1
MSHCREEAGDGGEHSSHHHHDHGHDHDHDHDGDGDGQSLYGMIDTTRVTCLNESEPGGILRCIKPWDRRMELDPYLESQEDDPELLIHVPFSQVVLWLRNPNPPFILSSNAALIYVRFVLGLPYEIWHP